MLARSLASIFLALLMLGLSSVAQELNTTQITRLNRLEHQFMSPCCYGEPLYGHLSPAATEMKQEISQMIVAGRTDREILDHFKAKFGQRILVEPEGTQWWVMNVVPVVMLVLGLLATVWIIRRWMRPAEPSPA